MRLDEHPVPTVGPHTALGTPAFTVLKWVGRGSHSWRDLCRRGATWLWGPVRSLAGSAVAPPPPGWVLAKVARAFRSEETEVQDRAEDVFRAYPKIPSPFYQNEAA